ncbi:MAG: flagellar biosynthesis protein, partial [Oscillospiraceae bacterium]
MNNINRIISKPLGQGSQNRFTGQGQNVDFKSLLQQSIDNQQTGVVFSKHAMQRVNDRQIDLSNNTLNKLNDAISMAKAKGVRDALILNGDSMF